MIFFSLFISTFYEYVMIHWIIEESASGPILELSRDRSTMCIFSIRRSKQFAIIFYYDHDIFCVWSTMITWAFVWIKSSRYWTLKLNSTIRVGITMHKRRYQNIQMSFREVNNMNDNFNIVNTVIIPKFQNIQKNSKKSSTFSQKIPLTSLTLFSFGREGPHIR